MVGTGVCLVDPRWVGGTVAALVGAWTATVGVVASAEAALATLPNMALATAMAAMANLVRLSTLRRLLDVQAELRALSQHDELTDLRRRRRRPAVRGRVRGRRGRDHPARGDGPGARGAARALRGRHRAARRGEHGHGDVPSRPAAVGLLAEADADMYSVKAARRAVRLSGPSFPVPSDEVGAGS